MTYAVEKDKIGREPLAVLEIDLDYCTLTYGVGACTAGEVFSGTAQAGGTTTTIELDATDSTTAAGHTVKLTGGTGSGEEGVVLSVSSGAATITGTWTAPDATTTYTTHNTASSSACYNTRSTCQDIPNYTKGTKTYRFCEDVSGLPVGIDMIPCINKKASIAPIKINPGKDIGDRGTLTITLNNFPHHDRGIDKYIDNRTYNSESQGTYFGKLLARNPYFMGREVRYLTGYLTSPFNWNNFKTQTFIMEQFEGPTNDTYKIVAKDLLKKAALGRVQIPSPPTGKLSANITISATTATVDIATDYGASGTCRIGDEEMTYTRSGLTLTLVRAVNGTEAKAHNAGATIQECAVFNDNCVNVLFVLLNTWLGIAKTKLPFDELQDVPTTVNDEWDNEKDDWLINSTAVRTVSKPVDAQKLINEFLEQFQISIWHDVFNDKIKLKANVPPLANVSSTALSDASNLLADKTQVKISQEKRLSRVIVHYNKINNAKDEKGSNYDNTFAKIDLTREGSNLYDGEKTKTIFCTWFGDNASLAASLAGRLLSRYADAPKQVKFQIDAKDDSLNLGDLSDITTVDIEATTGAENVHKIQIIQKKEIEQGHSYEYIGLSSQYSGRYAFIAPNTINDYGDETKANQDAYGYIVGASLLYVNGDDAHKII